MQTLVRGYIRKKIFSIDRENNYAKNKIIIIFLLFNKNLYINIRAPVQTPPPPLSALKYMRV